jgi:hypothetical protein
LKGPENIAGIERKKLLENLEGVFFFSSSLSCSPWQDAEVNQNFLDPLKVVLAKDIAEIMVGQSWSNNNQKKNKFKTCSFFLPIF